MNFRVASYADLLASRRLLPVLALVGCLGRDAGTGTSPSVPGARTGADPGSSEISDLPSQEAFVIKPEVIGELAVGKTIRIHASVRSLFDVGDVQLSIQAPEVVIAKANGWNAGLRRGSEGAVVPLLAKTQRFGRGSTDDLDASIVVERGGYYRIIISAVADLRGNPVASAYVQGTVHRELWLYVGPDGGAITDTFEAERVPHGFAQEPGPWKLLRGSPNLRSLGTGVANLGMSDGYDHYVLKYYDADSMAYVPVPDASIRVTYWREEYGNDVEITSFDVGSGSTGSFEVPCYSLYDGEWYDAVVEQLSNSDLRITGTAAFGWFGGAGGSQCGTYASSSNPWTAYSLTTQSRVFTQLRLGIVASESFFSTSRPQLKVKVFGSSGGSKYVASEDEAKIYSNAIWGEHGRFVGMHEYGHALYEKGLNGNPNSGACTNPHYVNQLSNFRCALSEGWASYVAAAVGFGGSFDFENTDRTYGCLAYSNDICTSYASSRDGSRVEGAVASMLLNLTDAANGPNDSTSYPGKYVADLVKTCTLYPGILVRVIGIDHLTYCLELNIDSYVTSNYFLGRSDTPYYIIGENATEPFDWSASKIRQVWLWNLYRE